MSGTYIFAFVIFIAAAVGCVWFFVEPSPSEPDWASMNLIDPMTMDLSAPRPMKADPKHAAVPPSSPGRYQAVVSGGSSLYLIDTHTGDAYLPSRSGWKRVLSFHEGPALPQ